MKALQIKVCGMRDPDNMSRLAVLKPDFMGVIFYPGSPRYVDRTVLEESVTRSAGTILTGVFVDAALNEVRERCGQFGLKAIQLHGSESPAYCEQIRLRHHDLRIIKAIGIDAVTDWQALAEYRDTVDYFLFDTKSPRHGGTGRKYDWNLLERYPLAIPYFLSGGIGPEDVDDVLKLASTEPRLFGIDLNSRFELAPGLKNIALLEETFTKIKTQK